MDCRTQLYLPRTPQETHLPINKTPENPSPLSPDVLTAAAWQFSVFEDQFNPPPQPCPQRSPPTTLKHCWQNGLTLQFFQLRSLDSLGVTVPQPTASPAEFSIPPAVMRTGSPTFTSSINTTSFCSLTQRKVLRMCYCITLPPSHTPPAKHRVGDQINGNLWNIFIFFHICPRHFLLFNSLWHLQAYFGEI